MVKKIALRNVRKRTRPTADPEVVRDPGADAGQPGAAPGEVVQEERAEDDRVSRQLSGNEEAPAAVTSSSSASVSVTTCPALATLATAKVATLATSVVKGFFMMSRARGRSSGSLIDQAYLSRLQPGTEGCSRQPTSQLDLVNRMSPALSPSL
jgi:hypothetical protein